MAFTRKFLAAQGIEADKADVIMAAHVEVVDYHKEQYSELKEQISTLKQQAAEANELTVKLEEANKKLEAYEKDDYKGKYESEKAAREKLESDIANKETNVWLGRFWRLRRLWWKCRSKRRAYKSRSLSGHEFQPA